MKRYQQIARAIEHIQRVKNEYSERAMEEVYKTLPTGSGIDAGIFIDEERSNENRIILTFEFHHMNEDGYYDGWTFHTAIVKPSLCWGFDLRITGHNRNQIKDYLGDLFQTYLNEDC